MFMDYIDPQLTIPSISNIHPHAILSSSLIAIWRRQAWEDWESMSLVYQALVKRG